jgi:hypothetical protein
MASPVGTPSRPEKVQVLGKAVLAEVALLERRAALERQRVPESWHLTDSSQNPGEKLVPLEHLPWDSQPLARFLKACV